MNHNPVRSEHGWDDPYHAAVCWERLRDQREHSRRVEPDEATWRELEKGSWAGPIYSWWGRALHRLERSVLAWSSKKGTAGVGTSHRVHAADGL